MFDFLKRKQDAVDEAKARYGCSHPETRLTLVTCSNGAIQYKRQCLHCHQATSSPLPHKSLTETEKRSAVPFDYDAKSSNRKWFYAERQKLTSEAFWGEYRRYLESDQWKRISRQVLQRDRYTCQYRITGCTSRATEAHHLTYARVGRESLEDLIAVCHHCHEVITDESRRQWRTIE